MMNDRDERLRSMREKVRRRAVGGRHTAPYTPPRYDEIWAAGVAAMESEDSQTRATATQHIEIDDRVYCAHCGSQDVEEDE